MLRICKKYVIIDVIYFNIYVRGYFDRIWSNLFNYYRDILYFQTGHLGALGFEFE